MFQVKHAFITRFNELCSKVYREYTVSLAYDMVQTRQETSYSDPSDLVARRMGFIPLPLGVAIARVLSTTMTTSMKPVNILLVISVYLILTTLRILINLITLGLACDFINIHSLSPIKNQETYIDSKNKENWKILQLQDENLSTTILSNSSLSLNNECSNECLMKNTNAKPSTTIDPENMKFQQINNFLSLPTSFVRAGSEPLLST